MGLCALTTPWLPRLSGKSQMIMVGAPDNVNDLDAGWHQTVSSIGTLLDLTAGDFDGDGKTEIAGLTFAPNGGLTLVIYRVDPVTLAVTPASSLVLTTPGSSNSNQIGYASISRGRFNSRRAECSSS